MLKLTAREREVLLNCDALTSDDEGSEILRGLTVSESCFMLTVERDSFYVIDAAEHRLYSQLKARHLAAMALYIASLKTDYRKPTGH